MNRRLFIKNSLLTSALLGLNPASLIASRARAQSATGPQFFVFLRFQGGMATTLGLDPIVYSQELIRRGAWQEYSSDRILRSGNILLGPAAEALQPFASEIGIINGIDMQQDIGHENINRLIENGGFSSQELFLLRLAEALDCTDLQALLSDQAGDRKTSLAGSLLTEVNSRITSNSDYDLNLGALARSSSFSILQRQMEESALIQQRLVDLRKLTFEHREALQPFLGEITGSDESVPRFTRERQNGQNDDQEREIEELKENIGVAALSFAAGLSRMAMIIVNSTDRGEGTLDTHNRHDRNHLRVQTGVWEKVAGVFDLFKSIPYNGKSLFDQTLFLVSNEFSRTIYRNATGNGTEHNVDTNSFLLAGAGAPKGRVIGGSRAYIADGTGSFPQHVGRPFDFQAKKALTDAELRALNGRPPRHVRRILIEDVFHSIVDQFGLTGNANISMGRKIF